jgi:hypothetical protein
MQTQPNLSERQMSRSGSASSQGLNSETILSINDLLLADCSTGAEQKDGDYMSETIVAALISAAFAVVVCLINNHYQQNKTTAIIQYKLDELTKQVEKHNKVIDRTYHLEEQATLFEEKMKVANHRLDDLERKVEKE